jgi:hypothetical protein
MDSHGLSRTPVAGSIVEVVDVSYTIAHFAPSAKTTYKANRRLLPASFADWAALA